MRCKLTFSAFEYMYLDDKLMFSVRKYNFSSCKDTFFL